MKVLGLIIFCLCFVSAAFAQLQKVKELPLSNISAASVDRLGNFYFVLPSGKIQKYDPNGNLLDESVAITSPLTLIEPWNPLKVFTYSNQTKKYSFWDHHLSILEEKLLEPSLSIDPLLVCPANENNKAWILDAADFSLKRVDLLTHKIEIEKLLPAEWIDENTNFVFMREYQNRLFILDKNNGIRMLNKLAIPITTIDNSNGLTFFNFLGEELCYKNGKDILLIDLYSGVSRKAATLPNPKTIFETIITDERLVVIRQTTVEFFLFKDTINPKN